MKEKSNASALRPQNDDLLEGMGKCVWEVGRLALWGDSIVTRFGALAL